MCPVQGYMRPKVSDSGVLGIYISSDWAKVMIHYLTKLSSFQDNDFKPLFLLLDHMYIATGWRYTSPDAAFSDA